MNELPILLLAMLASGGRTDKIAPMLSLLGGKTDPNTLFKMLGSGAEEFSALLSRGGDLSAALPLLMKLLNKNRPNDSGCESRSAENRGAGQINYLDPIAKICDEEIAGAISRALS